jgi:hypothetical protein
MFKLFESVARAAELDAWVSNFNFVAESWGCQHNRIFVDVNKGRLFSDHLITTLIRVRSQIFILSFQEVL